MLIEFLSFLAMLIEFLSFLAFNIFFPKNFSKSENNIIYAKLEKVLQYARISFTLFHVNILILVPIY